MLAKFVRILWLPAVLVIVVAIWLFGDEPKALFGENEIAALFADSYQQLLHQPDAELIGTVKVFPGAEGEDYEWRMATFQSDGKTPRVYKDLMKCCAGATGIDVRYQYFNTDGTCHRLKRIHLLSTLDAGRFYKFVEIQYSAGGKAMRQHREGNGDLQATFERVVVPSDELSQQSLPGAGRKPASVLKRTGMGYHYSHYCKDGRVEWWTFDYTFGQPESGLGKVYFDRDGKPFAREFTRHYLTEDLTFHFDVMPVYEDSFRRQDGTVEYRQTWVTVFRRDGTSFNALLKLEIFSADGKKVEREILQALPQWRGQILGIRPSFDHPFCSNATNSMSSVKFEDLPENIFQGFHPERWTLLEGGHWLSNGTLTDSCNK